MKNNRTVTTEVTYDRVKSNFKNFKDKLGKFGEKYKWRKKVERIKLNKRKYSDYFVIF